MIEDKERRQRTMNRSGPPENIGRDRMGARTETQPVGQTRGPVGSGIMSLGKNNASPPWWETQMGGSAYGPFHKSGPDDYSDMFKLRPGENYSINDLSGNRMLDPYSYFDYSPYKRDNPLMQATEQSVGSKVPDHLIYDKIYDDDNNIEGYSWNPYKEKNYSLINQWLPEEYSISPGVTESEDIFQFRDFPWMDGEMGSNNPTMRSEPTRGDTANLTQTWGDIKIRLGEDAANEWLASQQANSSQQANLGNYELFHLMGNGYTREEAQEIINEQGIG